MNSVDRPYSALISEPQPPSTEQQNSVTNLRQVGPSPPGTQSTSKKRERSPAASPEVQLTKQRCVSTAAQEPEQAAMAPTPPENTPPAWFSTWFKKFNEDNKKDKAELSEKLGTLKDTLQETVVKLSQDNITTKAQMSTVVNALTLEDSCEVVATGIPECVTLDMRLIAERILGGMGLSHMKHNVFDVRPWQFNQRNEADSSNSLTNLGLVIEFTSVELRDKVLKKAARLDKTDAQHLFGSGGRSKVYLNGLYPKPVYLLKRKAVKIAKTLNYAPPVVRNLIVCMRETRNSQLIPIHSDKDLESLPLRELDE